jgi:ABC-type lipoprotein export system ATPase subunit
MTSAATPVAECVSLTRTFLGGDDRHPAVDNVDCVISPHARIALLGPSGSGKSTLLHLLAQLDQPTLGVISWPGLGGEPRQRPGSVGMVFQAASLIDTLTAAENVMLPLLGAQGLSPTAAAAAAQASLSALDLGKLANRLPAELSAGQSQRVAIARALAGQPRLLLADEPTGKLDRATAHRVLGQLVSAAAQAGAALLIATHDVNVTEFVNDTWLMADGRLDQGARIGASV